MRKTKVTHNGTEKPSVESQILNPIISKFHFEYLSLHQITTQCKIIKTDNKWNA